VQVSFLGGGGPTFLRKRRVDEQANTLN
jgi:hypothetical protein